MLSALRDVRIWVIMVLGLVLSSAMWALLGMYVVSTLAERDRALAELTPEQRLEAELRMADHLSREVLGQEGVPIRELMAEQAHLVAELEAKGIEAAEEEDALEALDKARLLPETRSTPAPHSSAPPPQLTPQLGFRPTEPEPEPVSPLLAAMGCGGVILLFGALGAVMLLRTGQD